ncbi:unnamed protein product [Arabidopsis lyrata]|uniref:Auxin-responsive family protein n=1 Tax=Arabidopsis lyrata subsp. lyrata TaxID=81972 RepID=D7KDT6_ARALL|nr:hypothetical protein ARALYDRAFT_890465 [Arabidopsis lyrata subsp. lyrata]CAH8253862.1 unnamed protein product [Arabidopsis lyrata]
MMNTKKLIKMFREWQQRAALHRKRISFQKSSATSSLTAVEKGCFVVYTADNTRFAFPISYLSNSVFQELYLKKSLASQPVDQLHCRSNQLSWSISSN